MQKNRLKSYEKMPKSCIKRTGRWPVSVFRRANITLGVRVCVWQCQVAMRRGACVPPRLLSGDKAPWPPSSTFVSTNVVESSPWPGRLELSGRRPPCCIHWTHSPARFRRAAALIQTRTDTRCPTRITSSHHRRTANRSKW